MPLAASRASGIFPPWPVMQAFHPPPPQVALALWPYFCMWMLTPLPLWWILGLNIVQQSTQARQCRLKFRLDSHIYRGAVYLCTETQSLCSDVNRFTHFLTINDEFQKKKKKSPLKPAVIQAHLSLASALCYQYLSLLFAATPFGSLRPGTPYPSPPPPLYLATSKILTPNTTDICCGLLGSGHLLASIPCWLAQFWPPYGYWFGLQLRVPAPAPCRLPFPFHSPLLRPTLGPPWGLLSFTSATWAT